jgi:hypothetical protein
VGRTRKIGNQRAYHITNINADGTVPRIEPRSFTTEQNDDYRVSSQGKSVHDAPRSPRRPRGRDRVVPRDRSPARA